MSAPAPLVRPDAPARPRALILRLLPVLLLLLLGAAPAAWGQGGGAPLDPAQKARFAAQAEAWRVQLRSQVMPFWFDRTLDREAGGYLLPGAGTSDKSLVSHARLMWGFAHAHRQGIRDPARDYLAAATHGYRFLRESFRDPQHGGYYWLVNRAGRPLDQRKLLYGQAFAIYGLVEYHRASGDPAPLRDAVELYRIVTERAHDAENGGWGEHFEADWQPILDSGAKVGTGIPGTRSGNTLLHWMEALTALTLARREAGAAGMGDLEVAVEDALAEALDLALTHFFPERPGQAFPYRQPDWQRPLGAKFREISYGHNVEFGWLMLEAQAALGRGLSWQRFDAHLEHALRHGFDHERGGLYAIGFDDRPALMTHKIWWAQAEMLVALTRSLRERPDPERARALERLLDFLTSYQIDPQDGIWREAVQADGSPWRPAKLHHWKTSYHDVRAMMKFIEAFGPTAGGPD